MGGEHKIYAYLCIIHKLVQFSLQVYANSFLTTTRKLHLNVKTICFPKSLPALATAFCCLCYQPRLTPRDPKLTSSGSGRNRKERSDQPSVIDPSEETDTFEAPLQIQALQPADATARHELRSQERESTSSYPSKMSRNDITTLLAGDAFLRS